MKNSSLPPAPFWLLIFPEGTNLSPTTRAKSQSWAVKSGQEDLKHLLLPRHTGLLFCLRELQGSVDWLYDCTMGYGGVPYVLLLFLLFEQTSLIHEKEYPFPRNLLFLYII